jgi:alkyl sulfatase BDS1-like metallo-beta-lactamase superfamily hydrolase
MFKHCTKSILSILAIFASATGLVYAQDTSFVSKSLVNETVTGPNGAVTVTSALKVNEGMGSAVKVADEITPGVYHIRGWGIAHTIAIDAPEGWIIVDTGDSIKAAAEMRLMLEKKVGKKIKVAAILYTHSHYTDGTVAWLDDGTEIWGHEDLDKHKRADNGVSILSGNFGTRAMIQFGVLHPSEGPDSFPNKLGFGADKFIGEKGYLAPTKTFKEGETIIMRIADEPVEVAPNRTDVRDSVGYYFPERSALATNALGNSTIFNLYTLRGDRYRDPADFIAAHDWALAKNAEVLADIHGPGIKGRLAVREALELARDQLQLINDQTLRMVAKGMDGRRSAENVYMPLHMRIGYENYGQVESHVKQVYNGRIGWMGNDVYDINPLAVNEETRRMVDLMGGAIKVRKAAAAAVEKGGFEDWSWALKLTSMLLELDPNDAGAADIRAEASRSIGQRTTSANARGFYITEALSMEGKLKLGDQPVNLGLLRQSLGAPGVDKLMQSDLDDSFQFLRYLVDPRIAEDKRFSFTVDINEAPGLRRIELRNSVISIASANKQNTIHINVTRK